jgi:tetratricopeptide (TPR) repeat protein
MANVAKLKKRALDFEQKKQFDKALEIYAQILDGLGEHVDESDMALYNRVGDLMLRRGNISAAVDHYEKAVDLYMESGFFNNAIALCNKVLRNAPGRASVYYKLGKISAQKGFINDAKQNFLEFADRMQQAGDFEEAFRALKEFADLCPDQDDIRLMLADQLVRKERKGEAVEQLQRLHDKLQAEGRSSEARATADRMKAIDPDVQPRASSFMPTPRSSDLIFLDVNYDAPPGDDRPAPRAPRPYASPARPATPVSDLPLIRDEPELDVPPTPEPTGIPFLETQAVDVSEPPSDVDTSDPLETDPERQVSPDALSDRAALDPAAHAELDAAAVHQLDGLITGFDDSMITNVEQDEDELTSAPSLVDSDAGMLDGMQVNEFRDDTGTALASTDTDAPASGAGMEGDLPMLDIPLENDASAADADLTFIRFEDERPDAARDRSGIDDRVVAVDADVGEHGAWLSTSSEAGVEDDVAAQESGPRPGDAVPDMDAAAPAEVADADDAADAELHTTPPTAWQGLGESESETHAESPADLAEDTTAEQDTEVAEVSEPAPEPAPVQAAEPELPATDRLRVAITEQPRDWQLRRQLAEALFEEGNRAGGLAELEAIMRGLEDAKDLDGASSMVDEIIRVEPNSIRHHQKRVEYAVRSNDKARLVDSYVDLAEALFRVGELDKSRIVYGRVLELAPTDERVRAAIRASGGDRAVRDDGDVPDDRAPRAGARPSSFAPRKSVPAPTPTAVPAPPERWRRPTPTPSTVRAVPLETSGDRFVNLSDWLQEDSGPKSTRMVVDVREPAHNEQVDFAEMLAMFKKGVAANVDEADHESHYDLGVAYKEMGLLDEAISEFPKALRGADDRIRAYEALGQCFVEKEQFQIAAAILVRAVSDKHATDDMLVGVLYLLGVASEALQRWQDAQSYYERVFAIDIDFRDINERLTAVSRRAQ